MTAVVWVVGIIHTAVCLSLIAAILLHSGKGTGLSNAFGGGLPNTFAGTSLIERNLDRITIGLGIAFGFTSFALMLLLRTPIQ